MISVSYTHLIGKDDSENVEVEKFGEPVVPDFEIPYHTEIMENFDGIDLDLSLIHIFRTTDKRND